ncbi:MATE family efflux transporter [Clostridium sp. chh4-2]|uniref:MATE family efflux transporter n=1 Tax=Clostridium sp. chh4-2 TaxID=2067550 RepID=UPI000CCEE0E5|nr:MATE family efflux transporter [Clostridium sp. chh4-2]PNV62021.1 MATE family efflux transporter [Clostridium sp. chh4-2]
MGHFENDLSKGNVVRQLILFAFPFLVSSIIQSLYNVADMLIVGNFSGTASMSGVNIGGQVTFILTNVVVGLCSGGTVLVAQYLGAKKPKDMEDTIATLMSTLLAAGVIITIVMLVLKNQVLILIKTPAESFDEASRYLTVTVIGIIFIFGYNVLSAVMRGMGDSKRPFYFVLIACVTNIILDLLLVAGLKMGALGAAVATVFSQALSMVLCIGYMVKNNFIFDFKPSSFKFHKEKMELIIKIGLPAAVQNGVTSFSFLIITALVNTIGGVNASAAVGVVSKFNGFAIMPAVAMGSSIATMCAQNIGAGEWGRAIKTCRVGTLIAVVCSYVIFVLVQLYPQQILELFDDNPDMIRSGVEYFRTFSFDYLFVPLCFSINGLYIASGHTTFSLINSVLSALALRVPACILLGSVMGLWLRGIGLGAPIASMGSLILIIWFYFSGKWKDNVVKQ